MPDDAVQVSNPRIPLSNTRVETWICAQRPVECWTVGDSELTYKRDCRRMISVGTQRTINLD